MPTPKNLGLPCLLPVQVERRDGPGCRGFVTRLSRTTACISSDPELAVGAEVLLSIRRPSDDERVSLSGTVLALLEEGGLWRGRSAALVELATEIGDDFLGEGAPPTADVSDIPLRRGSEADRRKPYNPGRATHTPLSSGLGRRRRRGKQGVQAGAADARPPAPIAPAAPPPEQAPASPPPVLLETPALDSAELAPPVPEAMEASSSASPPPVHSTAEHIRAVTESDLEVQEAMLGKVDDDNDPDAPPILLPDGSEVLDERPPSRGEEARAVDVAAIAASDSLPPPVHTTASFEDDESWDTSGSISLMEQSLIPRAARIPSGVPVHYWTRGQRLGATARNFSREGMFLAYDGEAPSRGATVRVEFALGDGEEDSAIRFSAEVRWHRSDRPGGDLPEGFGVFILDFETAGDEERYSKLLLYLLAIQAPEPSQAD